MEWGGPSDTAEPLTARCAGPRQGWVEWGGLGRITPSHPSPTRDRGGHPPFPQQPAPGRRREAVPAWARTRGDPSTPACRFNEGPEPIVARGLQNLEGNRARGPSQKQHAGSAQRARRPAAPLAFHAPRIVPRISFVLPPTLHRTNCRIRVQVREVARGVSGGLRRATHHLPGTGAVIPPSLSNPRLGAAERRCQRGLGPVGIQALPRVASTRVPNRLSPEVCKTSKAIGLEVPHRSSTRGVHNARADLPRH